jgi:dTDP-4-dehydrorhamnose reductase
MAGGIERVLVLGGNGMLGHRMLEALAPLYQVSASFRAAEGEPLRPGGFFSRFEPGDLFRGVDARKLETVEECIDKARPDAVVNCIGVIRQLPEGSDPVVSIELNSLFPHRLAEICRKRCTWLIHVGTDCVFSGRKGSYTEEDPADAQDLYGRSKALGEPSGNGCITLRTSIIGRELRRSTGLLEWFLSRRNGSAHGFSNAIWSGLTTGAFSEIVGKLIERRPGAEGLYHVASRPLSKHELLKRINRTLKLGIEIIPTPEPVEDRSLCSDRFNSEFGIDIPSMDGMISSLIEDMDPYDEWRGQDGLV